MIKKELIDRIAQQTGIDKTEIRVILEEFMMCIKKTLSDGNGVYLRGFGSFIMKHRASKMARNIEENTTIIVPAHDKPVFKPSRDFSLLIDSDNHIEHF